MNFRKSTATYEEWLSHQLEIVPEDLAHKHQLMREAIFPFFRATWLAAIKTRITGPEPVFLVGEPCALAILASSATAKRPSPGAAN